eukprot:3828523-Pleurochrysis_carterae.AAC.3
MHTFEDSFICARARAPPLRSPLLCVAQLPFELPGGGVVVVAVVASGVERQTRRLDVLLRHRQRLGRRGAQLRLSCTLALRQGALRVGEVGLEGLEVVETFTIVLTRARTSHAQRRSFDTERAGRAQRVREEDRAETRKPDERIAIHTQRARGLAERFVSEHTRSSARRTHAVASTPWPERSLPKKPCFARLRHNPGEMLPRSRACACACVSAKRSNESNGGERVGSSGKVNRPASTRALVHRLAWSTLSSANLAFWMSLSA